MPDIRISVATPEADLSASVWPGMTAVYYPCVESASWLAEADAIIGRLEQLRGIRPGTVKIRPLIESSRGVTVAREIAARSSRVETFGVGPNVNLELGGDSLGYARGECELVARSLQLAPSDSQWVLD
jgi:citrate lyase beta subunit